jgi:hypothetical protein
MPSPARMSLTVVAGHSTGDGRDRARPRRQPAVKDRAVPDHLQRIVCTDSATLPSSASICAHNSRASGFRAGDGERLRHFARAAAACPACWRKVARAHPVDEGGIRDRGGDDLAFRR